MRFCLARAASRTRHRATRHAGNVENGPFATMWESVSFSLSTIYASIQRQRLCVLVFTSGGLQYYELYNSVWRKDIREILSDVPAGCGGGL
jgi:hypothetical protein